MNVSGSIRLSNDPLGTGEGPSTKRQKKSKKRSWFDQCSLQELQQLCKAALLPASENKYTLVETLLQAELTAPYAYVFRPNNFGFSGYGSDYDSLSDELNGLSNAELKDQLKEKGLTTSGKRFDLVLRLLQYATREKTGIVLKQAPGTFDEKTGKFIPKARAKKMKLPDPEKVSERMLKVARPDYHVQNNWSNNMTKDHFQRCLDLAMKIMQSEIIDKNLFERGEEQLAWTIVLNCLCWLIYPYGDVENSTMEDKDLEKDEMTPMGIGRCSWDLHHHLFPRLNTFVKTTCENLSRDKGTKLMKEWNIEKLLRDLVTYSEYFGVDGDSLCDTISEYFK